MKDRTHEDDEDKRYEMWIKKYGTVMPHLYSSYQRKGRNPYTPVRPSIVPLPEVHRAELGLLEDSFIKEEGGDDDEKPTEEAS